MTTATYDGPARTPDEMAQTMERHYGIDVCEIGEEGDYLIAIGHHDWKRVAAAFNRYCREFCGLMNIYDDRTPIAEHKVADDLRQVWAQLLTGCPTPKAHTVDDPKCGNCPDCDEPWGWWVTWKDVTAETPGAFALTVLQRW